MIANPDFALHLTDDLLPWAGGPEKERAFLKLRQTAPELLPSFNDSMKRA